MSPRARLALTIGTVVAVGVAVAGVLTWRRPGPTDTAAAAPATSAAAPGSAAPGVAPPPASGPASAAPATATLHYVSNTHGDRDTPAQLGFNLVDIGPGKDAIDALPPGQRALVWLGNLDNTNCTPGYSYPEFTAAVDRLAGDPKVFGYYLSDEPHPRICPDALAHVRQRADYIRGRDPAQKSFVVVLDTSKECGTNYGCEYSVFRPENSHVDLIGIDPFVCSVNGCAFDRIATIVRLAEAKGIPRTAMVPVIQAFGQQCNTEQSHFYALPTADQMRSLLAAWDTEVPHPVFDFAYTWRSEGPACPGLDAATHLHPVFRAHNGGA